MRLLLDAHLSGKHIASVLRARGHDVRAANEEPGLEGMNDPGLWLLAVQEGQILVTANIKDFMPIIQRWAEAGASHPGCILIPGNVPLGQFGRIIAGITAALDAMPEREDWLDYVHYLS